MRPNRILRVLIVVLAASCICLKPLSLQAQTSNANCGGKLRQLLKEAGYTYNTHAETTFTVDFTGKNFGKSRVVVGCGNGVVVSFVILAKKAAIQKTPRMLEALLSANNEYDYVKFLLDNDGDLSARIDSQLRLIDAVQLKNDITQVSSAADEIFPKISAFIKR